MHKLLEGFPEFRVEDRVDDRVDEAVHVAQPRGQKEHAHARLAGQVELATHRVHYVACEKGHPAYEENT